MKKELTLTPDQLVSLVFLLTALALPLDAKGQSDNFDSGSLSAAWTRYYANSSLVSFTFPTVGLGKGLRMQVSPVPGNVPAVAGIMRTNVYSDFYVALDLVNWAVENQAAVVSARFTPGGTFGLDGGSGMIFNYDAAQAGDSSTSRKGGELQINTVSPPFNATTLAACEMTLEPGHSYRFVFKCVGTLYTGQLYDLEDLTTPLAMIQADDSTYSSGLSGFISYSRNGTAGSTDVTIDNYYAAATDPNLAAAPALMHSIPGTPIVESRVPPRRWQNFHNPTNGISFTARTYTTNAISSSATRLRLNGVDFSSQLKLSTNGTTITGSLPGSALKSNALYGAQIELTDVAGVLRSTNTFWFDTFSDVYLSTAPVKVIECEEYNYSNGLFQLDPIPVSGLPTNGNPQVNGNGLGYYDAIGMFASAGTEGVDFHSAQATYSSGWNEYRGNDAVMTGEGIRQEIEDTVNYPDAVPPWDPTVPISTYNRPNDNTRQKYSVSNLVEYLVIRTHAGDWLNYSRSFAATNYFCFLRAGSFSSIQTSLSRVTSDPTQTNQVTSPLGTFNIPNLIRKSEFTYIPLLDTNGLGAILSLSGTNTLRLTIGGAAGADDRVEVLNYLLFVPAQVTVQSAAALTGPFADDAAAVVNVGTRRITIPMVGASRFYRLSALVPLKINGGSVSGGLVNLQF
jgi:hypothetical protein